jgi:hypothetical protein
VTELEPSGQRSRADEVGSEQFVQRGEFVSLRSFTDDGCQPDLERVANHGGALEHGMSHRREGRQLRREHSMHRHRDRGVIASPAGRDGVNTYGARRMGEGFEVEGIAAAESVQLVAERLGKIGVEQLTGLVLGQRLEVQPEDGWSPRRRLEHGPGRLVELRRAKPHHRQHPSSRRAPQ